jgi:flavin-binding protein dodecin
MVESVYRAIEVVGASTESWKRATAHALSNGYDGSDDGLE